MATYCATALSVCVLLVCAVIVPRIFTEIQNIWEELDLEMNDFKVKQD